MDEKNFKRHLRDLIKGKHNAAEHDWTSDRRTAKPKKQSTKHPKRG